MSAGVLFDAPGPRAVRRHQAYSVLTVVALVLFIGWVVWRLIDSEQFTAERLEVFVTPDYVRALLVDGLVKTLQMAAFAIAFAVAFGFVFGVGKLSDHGFVRWPCWLVVEFFRAVPVLLLMIFIFYAMDSPFWAVVLALTLYNGSVLAEVLRAGVLAVPRGQSEAAYALGMRKTTVMAAVMLPQAIKIMLPAIISQCVVALKDTALGSYILAPGLTFVSEQIYLEFDNRVPTVIVVSAIYIVVNLVLTALATWAQRRYVGEKRLEVPMVGEAETRSKVPN